METTTIYSDPSVPGVQISIRDMRFVTVIENGKEVRTFEASRFAGREFVDGYLAALSQA